MTGKRAPDGSQACAEALVLGMQIFRNVKGRLFLPALAALSILGTSVGYAAHVYSQEGDCCYEGSPCCHPGAPCCVARHEAATARN